jgi:preprotein translocase subunit YajC
MPFDPINLVLFAVLAVMVIFMFRNSRKRKAELEAMREKMVPGAEVMTNFGLFGTLIAVDEDTNVAQVETSPGTIVRLHRQTLSRVVDDTTTPAETTVDELPAEPSLTDDSSAADTTRRPAKSDGVE